MATQYASIPLASAQLSCSALKSNAKSKRFVQYPPEAVKTMVWASIHYHEMNQRGSGIRRVAEQAGVSQATVRRAHRGSDPAALRQIRHYFGLDENGVMDFAKLP